MFVRTTSTLYVRPGRNLPRCRVWIDALCINQVDNDEKSDQVQMMGKIYGSAALVLVCLGPHEDDSERFLQCASELERFGDLTTVEVLEDEGSGIPVETFQKLEEWALSQDEEHFRRFFSALDAFGNRPYWSRLWIVQEVACAKDLRILCGDAALSWLTLSNLIFLNGSELGIDEKSGYTMAQEHGMANLEFVEAVFYHPEVLSEKIRILLDDFGKFKCFHPRDRLFGVLRLVNWEFEGIEPIRPDYDTPRNELAQRIAASITIRDMSTMLRAFEIFGSNEDLRDCIVRRSQSQNTLSSPAAPRCRYSCGLSVMGKLHAAKDGRLVSAFHKIEDALTHEQQILSKLASDTKNTDSLDDPPLEVYEGFGVVALACPGAQAGDWLMDLGFRHREVLLVARPTTEDSCRIVGQVIMLRGYELCGRFGHFKDFGSCITCDDPEQRDSKHTPWAADIELSLTTEDVVVFFAQDLVKNGPFDPTSRFARLQTMVTSPCVSVFLTSVQSSNLYEECLQKARKRKRQESGHES